MAARSRHYLAVFDDHTDIDDLTLACQPANLLIEKTGYTTKRPGNGRTQWIPPAHLDTGQPQTNNHFHPRRYLTDADDEPD